MWLTCTLLHSHEAVWSFHNVLMRAVVTTCYMITITLIAAMIPFFGCAPWTPLMLHSSVHVLQSA